MRSAMQGMVSQALAGLGHPRIGILIDYDPDRHAVKVNLQPDNLETGWIPLVPLFAGPSFGVFVGPQPGLQALVIFQESDAQVGICIGFIPNVEDVPPSVPAGQMLLVDSAGAKLAFTNDGKLTLTAPQGLTVNANVQVNGAVVATGEGTFNGGHTVSQHTHTQPADSHGDTEQPTDKPNG